MNKISRRHAIKTTALAAAAVAAAPTVFAQPAPAPVFTAFTLPPLPYAADALEPFIDAQTMTIHHDKHHAAYVTNLNKAVDQMAHDKMPSIENLLKDLNSVPENVRTAVRNHGGGHYNHSLFWQMMKKGGGEPSTELVQALAKSFGAYSLFKQQFTEAATKIFGSGWAWLVLDGKDLKIETTPNQDTPLSAGKQVLLGLDVWEHAYYLKFQNKRADYITSWWNVVNWDFVAARYAKLKS
ncbi:MAG: superoxide dismutase [Verrucomicrobia bacterium]|nr:superoxide dismutase [Verrucomicrobiota bacterium]